MKVVFYEIKKKGWPFFGVEEDNFFTPMSILCLSAYIKKHLPKIEIEIYDFNALNMDFKGFLSTLSDVDVLMLTNDFSLFAEEYESVAKKVKEKFPKVKIIAGGCHFSATAEYSMRKLKFIDFIVKGEGEIPIVLLLKKFLNNDNDYEEIKGILYRKNGEIIINKGEYIIPNLDELPLPGYSLLPLKEYYKNNFWRGKLPYFHSRGCTKSCNFCYGWKQFSKNGRSCYRSKSASRCVDEIETMVNEFNAEYLWFCDGTFNVDEKWEKKFCEEIIKRGIKIEFFAFMRLDYLKRDLDSGTLELLVKAGLRDIWIGVERYDKSLLSKLGKENVVSYKVISEIHKRFPEVFIEIHLLYGLEYENIKTTFNFFRHTYFIDYDTFSIHFIAPLEGTVLFDKIFPKLNMKRERLWKTGDYMTPVMASKYLGRIELKILYYILNALLLFRPLRFIKGLFSKYPVRRKRTRRLAYIVIGEFTYYLILDIINTWRKLKD